MDSQNIPVHVVMNIQNLIICLQNNYNYKPTAYIIENDYNTLNVWIIVTALIKVKNLCISEF